MKAKLLKKLRKRFVWIYDPTSPFCPYSVYDKVLEKGIYDLPTSGYFYQERIILMMLRIIGYEYLWQSRANKFRKIKQAKYIKDERDRFLERDALYKSYKNNKEVKSVVDKIVDAFHKIG